MKKYDHKKIEKHWQKVWEKEKLYETPDEVKDKENFYQLVEFPYPSGNLHVGHWYAFSVPDIFVRAKRMQGRNVLYPVGFDAFGLPAENAAIKRNLNPRKWTEQNIENMKVQIRSMGASFDWSREVVTADPEYYKWTQWLFLKFYKKGLVYQAETMVNWCPSCKTVLANEQVHQGQCERCGTEVEQKQMKQWLLKITDYAERLLKDLEELDWPEEIKESQRNWIGKSVGAEIKFEIVIPGLTRDPVDSGSGAGMTVKVFTTRPDTIYGATYLVLAPEHKSIQNLESRIENYAEVKDYVKKALKKTERQRQEEEKQKTGVELKGVKAINPATGEKMSVWVADYVLGSVGTGAIMAVPAHDERDFEFAKKYELPYRKVIEPPELVDEPVQPPSPGAWGHLDADIEATVWTGDGKLTASGEFTGQESHEVRMDMAKKFGEIAVKFRMRDWVISRQRYWGCPIPVIHCEMCGKTYPVPEKDLPVELPELKDFQPKGDGKGPLARAEEWVKVKCHECGLPAERETDTMDTFVDSSWYFLRYLDPENSKEFASKDKMKSWMPVDRYSGGAEHTTMHLLYSRFWIKAMYDLELLGWNEPYQARMNRGIILGPDGQKMSKSRGNVVDPDDVVEELGADTVRMYLAFIGPYNEVGAYPWDPEGIKGIRRFLEKVWKMFNISDLRSQISNSDPETSKLLHRMIKKVTEDVEAFKFNTAIASMMSFVNKAKELDEESGEAFLKLLAPFAPHLTEEIWQEVLGNKKSIHLENWPEYDEALVREEKIKIPVQINGKVRTTIEVDSNASEDDIRKLAESDEKVKKYLADKRVKKFVYRKGKIVNFVLDS